MYCLTIAEFSNLYHIILNQTSYNWKVHKFELVISNLLDFKMEHYFKHIIFNICTADPPFLKILELNH